MGKYDILENSDRQLASYATIIKPPIIVPKPRNVKVKAIPIVSNTTSYSLEVSWDRPLRNNVVESFVTSYLVQFSRGGDLYGDQREILENGSRVARYENVGSGSFKARVASVMAINNKISLWVESTDDAVFFPINLSLDFTSSNSFWFE